MSKVKLIPPALLLCIAVTVPVWAQQQHIFKIRARGIGQSSSSRCLTGFRVRNLKGIVTALHGVVDVRDISASNGNATYPDLQIAQVDIDRDIALLTSPKLEAAGIDGLEIASVPLSGTKVKSIGYPHCIEQIPTSLEIRAPATRTLESLIPAGLGLTRFRARNSPNPEQSVVALQGPLVPGLSGAPILDVSNRVFAVGNGGLEQGKDDLVWAIPFAKDGLRAPGSDTRYAKLKQLPAELLFNDKADLPPAFPIEDVKEDVQWGNNPNHYVKTVLTISQTGEIKTVTTTRNSDPVAGLCVQLRVFFYGEDGNLLRTDDGKVFAYGEGHQWCPCTVLEKRGNELLGKKCPTEREDKLPNQKSGQLPIEILGNIHRIAIVHGPGSKDPLEALQGGLDYAEFVKSLSKAVRRDP